MPEIAVENSVCGACGAEVRPGTLYCYNCGEAIVVLEAQVDDRSVAPESDLKPDEQPADANNGLTRTANHDAPAKHTVEEKRPLKSAAEIRRRARAFERKPVEIVWEEHERAPGIIFVVVTLVLLVFAIAVVISAVLIK